MNSRRPNHEYSWLQFERNWIMGTDDKPARLARIDQYRREQNSDRHSYQWFCKQVYLHCLTWQEQHHFEVIFDTIVRWIKFEEKVLLPAMSSTHMRQIEASIKAHEDPKNTDRMYSWRMVYNLLDKHPNRDLITEFSKPEWFGSVVKWLTFERSAALTTQQQLALLTCLRPFDDGEEPEETAIVNIYSSTSVKLNNHQKRLLKATYPDYFPENNASTTIVILRSLLPSDALSDTENADLPQDDFPPAAPELMLPLTRLAEVATNVISTSSTNPPPAAIATTDRKKRIVELRDEIADLEQQLIDIRAKRARVEENTQITSDVRYASTTGK